MILVSQNRKKIINFEKIAEVIVSDKDICVRDNFEVQKGLIIATYESEERAKEVLKEIIKAYKETNYEYENCWCLRNVIYEMPENRRFIWKRKLK